MPDLSGLHVSDLRFAYPGEAFRLHVPQMEISAGKTLALAGRLGLDLSTTMDVIEQSSGQSWIGSDRMRRAIAGDYAPRAHTTLLAKDTRLAIEAAQAAGFDAALGALASGHFAQALQAGLGAEDDASLFKLPRTAG